MTGSDSTVKRVLAGLVRKGAIERTGSDKTGGWINNQIFTRREYSINSASMRMHHNVDRHLCDGVGVRMMKEK